MTSPQFPREQPDEQERIYQLLVGPPEPARRRFPLRLAAAGTAVALAAVLFFGGWFAHSIWQGEASEPGQDPLTAEVMPEDGYELDVRWGDVLARLAGEGVIDIGKFQAAAQRAGYPLTPQQMQLLSEGADEKIRIDRQNAYFLVNALWALGLANKNPILESGPISQGGPQQAGRFASTGGWTLGREPGPNYLSRYQLIELTAEQQAVVEEVAYNSYRPCCGNMTAFPDCNHGMAALALAELMASQGATADDIFQALKKISPYWFPTQYRYLAVYFEGQGQDWQDVDARTVMGRNYSSIGGIQQVAAQLQSQGKLPGQAGGGAAGCAP